MKAFRIIFVLILSISANADEIINVPKISIDEIYNIKKIENAIIGTVDTIKRYHNHPCLYLIDITSDSTTQGQTIETTLYYTLEKRNHLTLALPKFRPKYWTDLNGNILLISSNVLKLKHINNVEKKEIRIVDPAPVVVDGVHFHWTHRIENDSIIWVEFNDGFKPYGYLSKERYEEISKDFKEILEESIKRHKDKYGIELSDWQSHTMETYFRIIPDEK